jgi:hypothetical protein
VSTLDDTLDSRRTAPPGAGSGRRSNRPTRKWWAAQITGAGALALLWLATDGWDTEESVALVGLLVQALTTWLVPNADTAGGVPLRRA